MNLSSLVKKYKGNKNDETFWPQLLTRSPGAQQGWKMNENWVTFQRGFFLEVGSRSHTCYYDNDCRHLIDIDTT